MLVYRLSNGRIESVNTKIRLLTRIAFGFKSVHALTALVRLHTGGYQTPLPGRSHAGSTADSSAVRRSRWTK